MTAQFSERLRYQEQDHSMCTNPLSDYFAMGGANPGFASNCTALWRGYVGSWEIINERLYLTAISGTLKDGGQASLASIFTGFPDRVFAHWYSGTIRVPLGKRLKYVHQGYDSQFEQDLLLNLEHGVVKRNHIRHNGEAQPGTSTEGYKVGAMTVTHRANKSGEEAAT